MTKFRVCLGVIGALIASALQLSCCIPSCQAFQHPITLRTCSSVPIGRPTRLSTPLLATTRRSLVALSENTRNRQSALEASAYDSNNNSNDHDEPTEGWWSRFCSAFSQTANAQRIRNSTNYLTNESERRLVQLRTLLRVSIPSVVAGTVATLLFPAISLALAGQVAESGAKSAGALAVLAQDSSQFVQNFQTVASLLFSILVGQTCTYINNTVWI